MNTVVQVLSAFWPNIAFRLPCLNASHTGVVGVECSLPSGNKTSDDGRNGRNEILSLP